MSYSSEVLADSPEDYFRLGESSGATATNAGTGGHGNGTYVGSPTLGAAGLLFGDADTCVDLSGSGQYIETAAASKMYTALTVEAIIRADTFSGNRDIVGRRFNGDALKECWQFRVLDNGKLDFFIVAGGTYYTSYQSTSTLSPGTTYHVVVTWDGSNVRLYINGVLDATYAHTIAPNIESTSLKIGWSAFGSPFQEYWDGKIDEVAVYPSALSAARIAAHYDAGTAGPTTVTGGQATETDTAQAGSTTVGAVVSGGQAVETDAAQGGTTQQGTVEQGGQATETDTAQGGLTTVGAVVQGGQASETDTAQAGTTSAGVTIPGSQAAETDTAQGGATVVEAPPVTIDTENEAYARVRGGWAALEWEPAVVPRPLVFGAQSIYAVAYGEPTMFGTQVAYTMSEARAAKWRQRILVGGRDITYDRGVETPEVEYELADPLLYGPGTLKLPQFNGTREVGKPWLSHIRKGKRIKVQLVDDDNVVQATVYKGILMDPQVAGAGLAFALGGEAQGRASMRDKQVPVFRDVLDLKRILWRALTDLDLRFLPRLGEPGIGIRSLNFGGTGMIEHIEEALARATKRDGTMRTVMPDTDGVYRLVDKDTETVHWTLFLDEGVSTGQLHSDMAEQPNRVYATTIAPNGMRVNFAAVPGLVRTPAPDYPMDDNSNFGEGTTNEDTDTGDGISVMVNRLGAVGLLDIRDTPGGFDEDAADALARLQNKAKLTGPVGVMTPALWEALWDLGVTTFDRKWASIQPAAQDPSVQRYLRAASGAVIGLNPDYDDDVIPVDLTVDMGSGFTGNQAERWAETLVHDPDTNDWYGTITLRGGAVLLGQVDEGDAINAGMLRDARLVKPTENLWVPNFDGGTMFHIAAADVKANQIELVVDTRARPARQVWERIQVRRETRRNPIRRWLGNRQSTAQKDAIQGFLSWGGMVDRDVPLEPGWNTIEVVVGDYGTIAQIKTVVLTDEPHEHAVAVLGKPVTAAWMNATVPEPLAEDGDRAWRRKGSHKALRERWLLYSAGTFKEPCGYGADLKSDDAELTGEHIDDGGFPYKAEDGCVVTLAVWVPVEAKLRHGRVMWPLLEGGV